MIIPPQLVSACDGVPERLAWLERLPDVILALKDRWSLVSLGTPFDGSDVSCAWVAPTVREDGTRAVLKLGMPHMEAEHEIHALRFWDGNPTVALLESDENVNAMLLEMCEPGTTLRERAELKQDMVVAMLLRRLWRQPQTPHPFRALSEMTAYWARETMADAARWTDAGLTRAGLQLFDELSVPAPDDVLLATDLHAGNVLRAQREMWLAIDPKPFVGDRAYDATQHLRNCRERMLAAPRATLERFADILEVDSERVRLWMFARAAAEPRDNWTDDSLALARLLG